MPRFVPRDILSSYAAVTALNANFDDVAELMEKVLIPDGGPTAVTADVDFNHFRLRNVANAVSPGDAVPLSQIPSLIPEGPPGQDGTNGTNGAAGSSSGFAQLFSAASGMTIEAGIKRVKFDGYSVAGVGGADYIYDAAVTAGTVTANPRTQFLAADGRGFRLDPNQHLDIQMFGVIVGGNNATNGVNNLAGILAAIVFEPVADRGITPTIHWPMGNIYVSATINVHNVVHWIGQGHGNSYGGVGGSMHGTRIITPTDVTTIINHSSNTTQAGGLGDVAVGEITGSAFGSIYERLSFEQQTKGTSLTAYGFWMRGSARLYECAVRNIASHGYYMYCTAGSGGLLEGDCNNFTFHNCYAHTTGGDALHIRGQDCNGGSTYQFTTAGNTIGGCGIFDTAGICNTHFAPQITGYGNTGVSYSDGHLYELIKYDNGAYTIGGATTPGTNNSIWYDLGVGSRPGHPAWVPGATYKLTMPIFIGGSSTVLGGYCEHSVTLSHTESAAGGSIDGPFRCTVFSTKGSVNSDAKTFQNGIGSYRTYHNVTTNPYYAKTGAFAYTLLGTKNPIDALERPNILDHCNEQDGVSLRMLWRWSGKDQFLNYFNAKTIFSIGGPATTRTHGRDVAQPYFLALHDFALQDPSAGGSANNRIYGLRAAAPTGSQARGSFFYNMTPAGAGGILGWSTTATGTPGTQTPVRIYDQMPAMANVAAAPTQAEFNALLGALRTAGLMAV